MRFTVDTNLGNNHKMNKRKRSYDESDLIDEYSRQKSLLNNSFLQWINQCKQDSILGSWLDGCQDYITFIKQLDYNFNTRGNLSVCGTGDMGQLGLGIGDDAATIVFRPRQLPGFQGESTIAAACGGMHNIVVTISKDKRNSVWTWGVGDDGSLGRDGDEAIPSQVHGLGRVSIISVAAGDSHCLALSLSGDLFYWGRYRDHDGNGWILGDSGKSSFRGTQNRPTIIKCKDFIKCGGVSQIASGTNHSLALCGDGSVFSWGIQECGQLGRKTCDLSRDPVTGERDIDAIRRDHLEPQLMKYSDSLKPVKDARFVAAGSHHSFIVQSIRSRVFGCGLNQYGQLALSPDKFNQVHFLHEIPQLNSLGIRVICAGEHHSVTLSHDGKVYTFGRADSSELGIKLPNGERRKPGDFESSPQLVLFPSKSVEIANIFSGDHHSGAIANDGTLYTWGFGESAQLGLGKKADEDVPPDCEEPCVVSKNKDGDRLEVVAAFGGAQHTLILC